MKKKIFLIGSVVFIISVCAIIYLFGRVLMNNDVNDIMMTENDIEIETTEIEQKKRDNANTFADYFYCLVYGYWDLYGLEFPDYFTDNFKNKFSSYIDFYPELKDCKQIATSLAENLNDTGDKIRIEYTWEDENGKEKMSRVDYELTLTDDEKIDDFKIINVKYYDPITYNPLDGSPITLDEYYAAEYIQVLWRPFYYEDHPESPSYYRKLIANIPLSENCQIINLPKEPNECEGSFPYFKAIYGKNKLSDKLEIIGMDISSINFYKVEYDLNDKAQFTRIEFIDITEDEYNQRR